MMKSIPSGTVTFLFTDIQGSTRLWADHPDTMKTIQVRHDELLRKAVSDNNGYVFKTVGDQVCAAFDNAFDGLNAAISAQRALAEERWPDEIGSLKVRMGVHTGSVELRGGDYFGLALSRIARLHAAAHGGQVLISMATSELVRDDLPKDITLRDMGLKRLKDLIHPEHLFQVEAPGLPRAFPPLKTLDSIPNNLPMQPTPFIGRGTELAEMERLLDASRLLTLTGPGGTGKTRLALQVGADVIERFSGGVYFVPLASITNPDFVLTAIADTLSVTEVPGQAIIDTLYRHLVDQNVLLILDNFEQVISAAPTVSKLLQHAPRLSLLITSRESLRLSGEQEFPVSPLTLPDLDRTESFRVLSQYEAVELFIQRAQAINPSFQITNSNAPAVAEICVRLDGLPLAIELAAARIKLFSPQQLLKRLGERFKVLTGTKRDIPERHQTLRNAVDWSYTLLDDGERILFDRLGVFAGGFTLDAAEQICGPDLTLDVVDGVGSLLNKSLIRQSNKVVGEPRFWMLETIREYAVEHLSASQDTKQVHASHARFFANLVEHCLNGVYEKGEDVSAWMPYFRILKSEHENLRVALEWSISSGEYVDAFRIIANSGWYYDYRNDYTEALFWANRLLATRATVDPRLRGQVHFIAAVMAYHTGDYSNIDKHFSRAIKLARQSGNRHDEARALMMSASSFKGDFNRHQESEKRIRKAMKLYEELNDSFGTYRARVGMGELLRAQGRFQEALDEYEAATNMDKDRVNADILINIGFTKKNLGDNSGADKAFRQALINERKTTVRPDSIALAIAGLASVSENKEKSVRLVAASDKVRTSVEMVFEYVDQLEYEKVVKEVKSYVDIATFDKLSAEGRSMTIDEIVGHALDESTVQFSEGRDNP